MLVFKCVAFHELTLDELYALLRLRAEVFVVEQNCVYQDLDGKDRLAYHLLGFDKDNELVAYTRLLPKGISYPDHPSIGRVITSMKVRRTGAGKVLMEKSIEEMYRLFGVCDIKIGAQCYLDKFYRGLGFLPVGDEYLEDGIPHISMIRKSLESEAG